MADIIKATCAGGKVLSGGFPVKAEISGAGKGQSSGNAILEKDKGLYIPDHSPDLEKIITQIGNALNAIASGINSVYVASTGGAPGPGAAQIQSACQSAKSALDTLKGQLI